MTDAFLRTICQHPHDLAARLIYADWLTERGEVKRSEFIRVQIELTQVSQQVDEYLKADIGHDYPDRAAAGRRLEALRKRERELFLSRYSGGDLFIDVANLAYTTEQGIEFRCRYGFAEEVHCTLTDWLEHSKAIVQATPVTKVMVTDREPRPENGQRWAWWNAGDRPENPDDDLTTHSLPGKLWRQLKGHTIYGGEPSVIKWFPSTDAAQSALSNALIHHARQQVGWEPT